MQFPWLLPTILGDNQEHAKDPYFAYMSPFNAGSLVAGRDYTESLYVQPTLFPDATVFTWKWPSAPAQSIYNFLNIQFGKYNYTPKQTSVPPRQVKNIQALTVNHDIMIGGDATGFDVIIDLFLTTASGNCDAKAFEIEIFLHTPQNAIDFFNTGSWVGQFTASGRDWKVVVIAGSVPNILIMPTNWANVLIGPVDLKAMFSWLVAQRVLTGNEWFNGLAMGAEVKQNGGTLAVNAFSVAYA